MIELHDQIMNHFRVGSFHLSHLAAVSQKLDGRDGVDVVLCKQVLL